ncbi:hypothetical protein ACFQX8_04915 [Klenkia terrae]|uniref:hypothetical protein n=1 Tax=Klenkia terrae TaxID=1052259 RepID=UPI003612D9AD
MNARRGRRDNGLQAALWHPLRDVDPRVGEHLLDVLREEGIAAYLAPSTDVGPYTRTQFLPSPPTDRLFVDRARRADARTLVDTHADEHLPAAPTPAAGGPTGPRTTPPPTPSSPASSPPGRPRRPPPGPPTCPSSRRPTRLLPAGHPAGHPAGRRAAPRRPPPPPAEVPVLDRPDEHFEPPAPPPLPVLAPASLYALLLILAGAVCIVTPGTLGLSLDVGIVIGVLAVVGGVAVLVSRMRDRSDDDGDGAVV